MDPRLRRKHPSSLSNSRLKETNTTSMQLTSEPEPPQNPAPPPSQVQEKSLTFLSLPPMSNMSSILIEIWQREWTTSVLDTVLLSEFIALDFTNVPSLMDMQLQILQAQMQHRLRLKHLEGGLEDYTAFLLDIGKAIFYAPRPMSNLAKVVDSFE
ncbi:hypothetical protein HMI55_000729 [Coelomomyces lativittatus]|nr:hypothetical protein HMI55_000729 [Coelomomyces lativittatus]